MCGGGENAVGVGFEVVAVPGGLPAVRFGDETGQGDRVATGGFGHVDVEVADR